MCTFLLYACELWMCVWTEPFYCPSIDLRFHLPRCSEKWRQYFVPSQANRERLDTDLQRRGKGRSSPLRQAANNIHIALQSIFLSPCCERRRVRGPSIRPIQKKQHNNKAREFAFLALLALLTNSSSSSSSPLPLFPWLCFALLYSPHFLSLLPSFEVTLSLSLSLSVGLKKNRRWKRYRQGKERSALFLPPQAHTQTPLHPNFQSKARDGKAKQGWHRANTVLLALLV